MEWIWGAEVGEELGEEGEMGTVIRIHNVRKRSLCSIKEIKHVFILPTCPSSNHCSSTLSTRILTGAH